MDESARRGTSDAAGAAPPADAAAPAGAADGASPEGAAKDGEASAEARADEGATPAADIPGIGGGRQLCSSCKQNAACSGSTWASFSGARSRFHFSSSSAVASWYCWYSETRSFML